MVDMAKPPKREMTTRRERQPAVDRNDTEDSVTKGKM